MKRRTDKIFIISELHPQHGGDIDVLESMILQSKMGGANAVKLQLYTSELFLGDNRKEYAEVRFYELEHLKNYANRFGIELFASVFDDEKIEWCEKLDILTYKIPSKKFTNIDLCNKIIQTKKKIFVSNGFNLNDFRYKGKNIHYFYCIPEYPTIIEKIQLPDFYNSIYEGYSDHTPGLTVCFSAVVKGAKYIEKHFTLSHALQSSSERGHLGGMIFEELKELRKFCDEFVLMG